jgi:hypothetical protein
MGKPRLEAFSDGVVAVIITIIVLAGCRWAFTSPSPSCG